MWDTVRKRSYAAIIRRAHLEGIRHRVPLMYSILIVDCLTIAYVNYGKEPVWLTLWLPVIASVIACVRLLFWRRRPPERSDEDNIRITRIQSIVGIALAVICTVWALILLRTGDADTRTHMLIVVATTFMANLLLIHLRAVASAMMFISVVPISFYLLSSGDRTSIAIAFNLLAIATIMTFVLYSFSKEYENVVVTREGMKELSEENARLAETDMLTSLPNRRRFFEHVNYRTESAYPDERFVVGVVDLDGFKAVNDLYGHIVGDEVLVQVAQRLKSLCHGRAFVARLAGDEFAIVMDEGRGVSEVLDFGHMLCQHLEKPYEALGAVANISGSIGFATFPEGKNALTLYERADFALFHAKQHRRGRPVMFSQEHEVELRKTSQLEQALKTADLDAELYMVFQPVMDVERGRPIAFEALARWRSPEFGEVSPGVFIPIVERSELISRITQVLLRKALEAAARWPSDIHLTFNLSIRDLISPPTALQVVSIVRHSGFDPARITFEITETALLMDFSQAEESIRLLKALGAQISLDDFGVGYSSLNYVYRLPLDKIKIDRSFVNDIVTEQKARQLVQTILGMSRDLDLECIAEGMETPDQVEVLRELGCKVMQGYHFSRPMPQTEIPRYLQSLRPKNGSHNH